MPTNARDLEPIGAPTVTDEYGFTESQRLEMARQYLTCLGHGLLRRGFSPDEVATALGRESESIGRGFLYGRTVATALY